jgi:hypothetical protein
MNVNSVIAIVVYLLVVTAVWQYLRRNITDAPTMEEILKNTMRPTSIERFDFRTNPGKSQIVNGKTRERYNDVSVNSGGVTRSFGTILKSDGNIAFQQSKNFRFTTPKMEARMLPESFDGREVWKYLSTPVMDQGDCGNCYAYSTTHMLADRFAIMSLGQIMFVPSPAEMAICSHNYTDISSQWGNIGEMKNIDDDLHKNRGCNGATLYEAVDSLYTDGTTTLTCFPMSGGGYNVPKTTDSTTFPYCYTLQGTEFDTCVDKSTAMRVFRASTSYNIYANETSIMHDLIKYGPISTGFMIFPDFSYTFDGKSIYRHTDRTTKQPMGGHAIIIYGWGTEVINGESVKYWILKNSWSKSFGLDGYFKMERNLPDINLEQNCVGVIPEFPGMKIVDDNLVTIETADSQTIKNFAGHILDKTTGFYTSAIEKVKLGRLMGRIVPYINENFPLPDYYNFWAMDVNVYIKKLPDVISPSGYAIIVCNSMGTSPSISVDLESKNVKKVNVVNYGSDISPPQPTPIVSPPQPSPQPSPQPQPIVSPPQSTFFNISDKTKLDILYVIISIGGSLAIYYGFQEFGSNVPDSISSYKIEPVKRFDPSEILK